MNDRREHSGTPKEAPARPSPFVSLVLFVVSMGIMGALRLYVFPHRFIALAWGLPLLLCLWHRDRRLLWALTLGFGVMSTYKALVLRPDARLSIDESEWLMQLASIGVLAAAIHSIVALTERLHEKNEELRRANGLLARNIQQQKAAQATTETSEAGPTNVVPLKP